MNRSQIERAERVSEILAQRRIQKVELLQEAKEWTRPRSLARPKTKHDFTDEQMAIAIKVLEQNGRL